MFKAEFTLRSAQTLSFFELSRKSLTFSKIISSMFFADGLYAFSAYISPFLPDCGLGSFLILKIFVLRTNVCV